MSSSRGIFKNVIVVIALISYIVVSIMLISDNRRALRCTHFEVIVLDSASASFVTPSFIDSIVLSSYGEVRGRLIDSIDFFAIEQLVESEPYVKWSDVYHNAEGRLSVKITQREPIMRIVSESGYDFYVDTSLHLLQPLSFGVVDVPIISGDVAFSFPATFYGKLDEKKAGKDIQYIKKLINFVQFISSDDFLRGFVMQTFLVDGAGGVVCRIVPRIGNQTVIVGDLDSIEQKLVKVKAFYLQYYGSPALDSVRQVDVSYRGQIITR